MAGSRVLRFVLGAFFACALVAAAEGGARLLAPPPQPVADESAPWMEPSADLGWRLRPGIHARVFGESRTLAPDGLFAVDSGQLRQPDQRRILLLGDSRTFGNGVPTAATFGEVLDRRLADAQVINLAVPGYSSYQGLAALRLYAPRLRPDVVVFAFGFNDRRYVLAAGDADGAARFHRLARQGAADGFARSLALVRLLDFGRRARWLEKLRHQPVDVSALAPRVSPPAYRDNLEAVARYCADRHVRLLFLLLNDNPRDVDHLELGMRLERHGRGETAERELRSAIASGNDFADAARRSLAEHYRRDGRAADAAAVAMSPRTLLSTAGGYPLLPGSTYRAVELEVAAAHGIELVRAGRLLDRHPDWYFDFCHFTAPGHAAVAGLLARALAAPAAPSVARFAPESVPAAVRPPARNRSSRGRSPAATPPRRPAPAPAA
ncbi:MAG TPA: SGNH/GDSL hydrolase family protein [Thermoanaerobaculia bacterium]|nr:SGNH/GDSL hydrolase family protein [Thermoanaerobaculia bacterium]